MSNIAIRQDSIPALQMDSAELMAVLRTSLYPGAQDESIKMVLGYCKATGLDPMQKPVHIVPMWDKVSKSMRDVIMPGIGLYRTQAARSGELAGISEPEFGPDVEMKLGDFTLSYPDWCKVTVSRTMANGQVAHYTAREYWTENYATAGKDTFAPNTMWKKRPRGQIAKCAQAQALRMAFPEMTGSQPTADEMEGRPPEDDARTVTVATKTVETKGLPTYPEDAFKSKLGRWQTGIEKGGDIEELITFLETKNTLSDEQKNVLRGLTKKASSVTFARVSDGIRLSTNIDQLQEAGELIGEISDPQQRQELQAEYDAKADELPSF